MMRIQASIFTVPLLRFVWVSSTFGLPAVHGAVEKDANLEHLRALMAVGLPQKSGARAKVVSIQSIFRESFRLQAETGDLWSASKGFEALTRARRGDPWSGHAQGAPGSAYSPEPITERVSGGEECVEAFLGRNDEVIRAFASRAADTAAAIRTGEFSVPSTWGADPLSLSTRGCHYLTAIHKLDHDQEQLQYLIDQKRLPEGFETLVDAYDQVRSSIVADFASATEGGSPKDTDRSQYYMMRPPQFSLLRGTYNSLLFLPPGPSAWKGASHPTGFRKTLNPNLDWVAIEDEYLSQETPLLWFDEFLLPEALEGVLEFCREATVFFDVKPGYLGAYLNDGLTSPWLLQLERELRQRLPRVLEGMTLTNMWAYKFDSDSSMDGIAVHADSASVNLNFWVTPDDANLDPDSGGLVVYPKVPPEKEAAADQPERNVDGALWNNWGKGTQIKAWLKEEGVLDTAVTIPYRQNRVVVFDSRLLHETDVFRFRAGYQNRRINITLLFSPAASPEREASKES